MQRGTARYGNTIAINKVVVSVSISDVNPEKSIVIAEAGAHITSTDTIRGMGQKTCFINDITEFTKNKVSFDVVNYAAEWIDPTVVWQVIEFN